MLDAPLTTAWGAVKIMYTTRNNEVTTESYLKIHDRAKKAQIHKFQSKSVYNACKVRFIINLIFLFFIH